MDGRKDRIDSALAEENPARALGRLVERLHDEGSSKAEIVAALVTHLHGESDGDRRDALNDVLDALHGWVHPDAALLDEEE